LNTSIRCTCLCIVLCLQVASNLFFHSILIFKCSKLQGYAMYCEVPPQVLDQLKQYLEDYKFLSGTSACRWYINENDIPAMRTFQRGYFFNSEF